MSDLSGLRLVVIRFTKLHDDVDIPERAHELDAAFDLRARDKHTLRPRGRHLFLSGLKMSLPAGFVAMVLPRSGLAANYGITVLNSPGLVDPGFRGELGAILINLGHEDYTVSVGDRIAQLMVVKFMEAAAIEDALAPAPDRRGEGGFGSTGV